MSGAYHHGALREALLAAALAEVRRQGAEQLSLRGLATTVGVSPSAVYNHFADKDALLWEVGQVGYVDLDDRMAGAVQARPGDDDAAAVGRFRGLGEAYLDFAIEDPHLFRLTFGPLCFASHEPEADGPYARLCASLDELGDRGLMRPGIRPTLELTVWAAVHGLAELLLVGGASPDVVPEFLDSVAALVLQPATS